MRERLVQGRHDETTGAGEDLVSAPDHIIRRANHGVQGTEDEPAGRTYGIRHALEAKRTAHARLDEEDRIVEQVVGAGHLDFLRCTAEVMVQLVMLHRLLRYNERLLQEIGALYGLFDRQRVVCPHHEAPGIVVRDAAKHIRPRCIRPADEPEVEQSLLQRIECICQYSADW